MKKKLVQLVNYIADWFGYALVDSEEYASQTAKSFKTGYDTGFENAKRLYKPLRGGHGRYVKKPSMEATQ